MRLWNLSLMLMLLFVVPAGAGAAEYFQYETDEGVVAFVDDEKKIPARYRDSARQLEHASLADYSKLTVTEKGAAATAAVAVEAAAGHRGDDGPVVTWRKEYRWVEGAFGAPGAVWAPVEIIEHDGEEVSAELHDGDTVRVIEGRLHR